MGFHFVFKTSLFCALAALLVRGQFRFACESNFCQTKRGPCPKLDCDDGRIIKNATDCGCCHICVKPLGENSVCDLTDMTLPRVECGPGLVCIEKKCVKASTNCGLDQRAYDENRRFEDFIVEKPRPECDEFGFYKAVVCKPGMLCHCLDRQGNRIFGTDFFTANETMNCNCSREFIEFSGKLRSGHDFLRCLENGNYDPLQCTDSACFCVGEDGKLDGRVISSNTSLVGLKCYNAKRHKDYLGKCWREYDSLIEQTKQYRKPGMVLVGLDLPKCELDGSYAPVQCKGDRCNCTTKDGEQYEGYAVARNSNDADGMNCRCVREKELLRKHERTEKVTQTFSQYKCYKNGNYLPIQCVDAFCFCVDEMGFQNSAAVLMNDRQTLLCYDEKFENQLE